MFYAAGPEHRRTPPVSGYRGLPGNRRAGDGGMNKTIDIGSDFTPYLGGRSIELETLPDSGERFMREHLLPAFIQNEEVTVLLDSIKGPTSSFLSEVFGELVVIFGLEEVRERLTIRAERKLHLLRKVESMMEAAESTRHSSRPETMERYGEVVRTLQSAQN